jgi:hypothetical protein
MVENLGSKYEEIDLVGGNDRQLCGERLRNLPLLKVSEVASGADEHAFGAEAKRGFAKLALVSTKGLVLVGSDGAYTWCTVQTH